MIYLESAILLAVQSHEGQFDADGTPHILHSLEVMFAVKNELEGRTIEEIQSAYAATREELLIAAVLHDVVEDTPVELDTIRDAYGQCVAGIVDSVTRRAGESYRDFIYRARVSKGGRLVKKCDLLKNIGRLPGIKVAHPQWHDKLDYKYHIALRVLDALRDSMTWEQASWKTETEYVDGQRVQKFYTADPNGKRIEVTQEQIDAIRLPAASNP
jgi:hypothetical protein